MTNPLAVFDKQILDGLLFCKAVHDLVASLHLQPEGVERLRLRQGVEKRLADELLPICRYIQNFYRSGRQISVRWVDGNQSYDAELYQPGWYSKHGYYPEAGYLEVTSAMHEQEHWRWKLLNEGHVVSAPEGVSKAKGQPAISAPVVFNGQEHVEIFAPIVANIIRQKSTIKYPPDTSLIVKCELNSFYTPEDWLLLVSMVEEQVLTTPFREVVIYDALTETTTALSSTRSNA
jgi:hypothetical protein